LSFNQELFGLVDLSSQQALHHQHIHHHEYHLH